MRTKVLLGAAAIAAASALSTMAQNVYSLNVVGYYNLTLPAGFSLIANQLDADGTGTNNTAATVFGNALPAGAVVYTWNGASYNISTFVKAKGGGSTNWSPVYPLNPGEGAWLNVPAGGAGTYTIVGQVLQGALVNPNLPAAGGYSLVSSMVPLSGGLTTVLGYQPLVGDQAYQWNGTDYTINTFVKAKGGGSTNWSPAEPSLGIGEGFWLKSGAGAVWSNYFVVGP